MPNPPTMRSFVPSRQAHRQHSLGAAVRWLSLLALMSLVVLGLPSGAFGESIAPSPPQQRAVGDGAGGSGTGSGAGTVELPREVYDRLIEAARNPTQQPRPAPASFALGNAEVTVDATSGADGAVSAVVNVSLAIETLEDDWVLVPVLPAGTSVASAKVGGNDVQLVAAPTGLAWATRGRGKHRMSLKYRVDASGSEGGMSLALPMPAASSIRLTALLPGADLDASVIPAAGVELQRQGNRTQVRATVPSTQAVQLLWRAPLGDTHTTSRARYTGTLEDDALTFEGSLDVEVFRDAAATLDLVPRSVTLRDVKVDGKPASIFVRGDRFATLVRGRGPHTVKVVFQVPVARGQGLPGVTVDIPAVPVSRFDLVLPGRKELVAEPVSSVKSRFEGGQTRATVFAPMSSRVAFRWTEAVPEAVRTETRANASLYHAAWAEEGVLFVQALVRYEISRGEASAVQLTVPADVQVDSIRDLQVSGGGQAVADWRSGPVEDGQRTLSIYLNRPLEGELVLAVDYDRPLPKEGPLAVPLVRAPAAQRSRGMIALLQSRDLTLEPTAAGGPASGVAGGVDGATRVGENQLPALVREQLSLPVAHTFKYVESPVLSVLPSVPERQVGKFDAAVDTLISLGEVTLEASATVEIDVKSGGIESLRLVLPAGVTLLGLTGPSIRTHSVVSRAEGIDPDAASQTVDVAFTQAMEGQFRLEARYERILQADAAGIEVPTLAIEGADVEQGRIAVEALSAVEVQAASAEHLTSLDPGELPRQLLLRTSNPILLAYKYVRALPRPALELAVQRHRLLGVQEAVIDQADYRTLLTRDGMAVTTARFVVRNSRKQFLRLALPEGARVWSAFVDGQSEKPALASATEGGEGDRRAREDTNQVLLKIKNATDGFVVELIYEVPGPRLGSLGTVHATLPQPDILVTHTQWDVFLPADLRYGTPRTSMDLAAGGALVAAEALREEMALAQDASTTSEPLVIAVPAAGVRYSFTKLYANQRDDVPVLKIGYASRHGAAFGSWLTVLATLFAWLGLSVWLVGGQILPSWRPFRRMGLIVGMLGMAGVVTLVGAFHLSLGPALNTTAVILVAGAIALAVRWWRDRRDAALDF